MNFTRKWFQAAAAAAVAVMGISLAHAEDAYPSKPVRMLVPYAPGGATDIIARIVAQKLTESLGQSFIVENKPGANGNIAMETAAHSAPDGYTLFVGNVSTNTINETVYASQMKIKPSRDLAAIAKLVEIPHVVVASAAFPANSIADLVAMAKKDPGKINFASVGLGSYPHLDMERLEKAAGIKLTHVPYKGGAGQVIPALISNEVQVAFLNMASLLPHIKSGRLKALAAVGNQRLAELPNVATMAEQGYPGIGTNAWQGLFAPAGTPKPVIDKLYAGVVAAIGNAQTKESLAKQMMTVALSPSPQAFDEEVRKETQAWADFLHEAKISFE